MRRSERIFWRGIGKLPIEAQLEIFTNSSRQGWLRSNVGNGKNNGLQTYKPRSKFSVTRMTHCLPRWLPYVKKSWVSKRFCCNTRIVQCLKVRVLETSSHNRNSARMLTRTASEFNMGNKSWLAKDDRLFVPILVPNNVTEPGYRHQRHPKS